MKKLLATLLALTMALSLCACGEDEAIAGMEDSREIVENESTECDLDELDLLPEVESIEIEEVENEETGIEESTNGADAEEETCQHLYYCEVPQQEDGVNTGYYDTVCIDCGMTLQEGLYRENEENGGFVCAHQWHTQYIYNEDGSIDSCYRECMLCFAMEDLIEVPCEQHVWVDNTIITADYICNHKICTLCGYFEDGDFVPNPCSHEWESTYEYGGYEVLEYRSCDQCGARDQLRYESECHHNWVVETETGNGGYIHGRRICSVCGAEDTSYNYQEDCQHQFEECREECDGFIQVYNHCVICNYREYVDRICIDHEWLLFERYDENGTLIAQFQNCNHCYEQVLVYCHHVWTYVTIGEDGVIYEQNFCEYCGTTTVINSYACPHNWETYDYYDDYGNYIDTFTSCTECGMVS